MKSVFISYDHKDQNILDDIKSIKNNPNNVADFLNRSLIDPILNEHGHVNRRTPIDPKSLPVRQEIEKLLKQSSKLLVLIGRDTHSSEWVKWEIGTFTKLKKKPDILLMRASGEQLAGAPSNAKHLEITNWNFKKLSWWLAG